MKLSALQIPLQVRHSSDKDRVGDAPALPFRPLALQSRQLLVGQPRHLLAPVPQRLAARDGGETRVSSSFVSFR